jgi:L-fucose isomerase-like protein
MDFDLVFGERTVASRADAETVARQCADAGADLILLLCNSFIPEGEIVLPLAHGSDILGLWALPEPEHQGNLKYTSLVTLNLFSSMLRDYGGEREPRCKWFLGEADDPLFRRRIEVTIRALRVMKGLRGARIGYFGGHVPGFGNLAFDERKLARNLGIQITTLPLDIVLSTARDLNESAARAEGGRIATHAVEVHWASEDMEAAGRISLALRQVAQEHALSAMAVRCWPQFYEQLGSFPCVAYGTLCSEGTLVGCEGDVLGALSLLALDLASDAQPTLTDFVSVDEEHDAVCFWHCGLAAWNMADPKGVRLIARPVPDADGGSNQAGGFADVSFASGPATIARLDADATRLLLAGAEITDLLGPGFEGSGGWFTNLRMMHESVTPLQFLDAVVQHGIAHHYAIVPQDVTDALTECAAWLGIDLVEAGQAHDHV